MASAWTVLAMLSLVAACAAIDSEGKCGNGEDSATCKDIPHAELDEEVPANVNLLQTHLHMQANLSADKDSDDAEEAAWASQHQGAKVTADCKWWCANKVAKGATWETICGWNGCSLCSECNAFTTTTTTTTVITTTTTTTSWQSPYFLMTCDGTQKETTESMTLADYDAVTAKVQGLYDSLPHDCNATYCPQADWAGCVLRIAGHDFMDYADGEGGADGCLDMEDADNAGLAECIYTGEHGKSIADAYKDFCTTISLADFFVISAEAVMNSSRAHVLNDDPTRSIIDFRSSFKYGRTTGKECAFAHGRLPNPEHSCTAVETTFVNRMGLSWNWAAALMGVHSLGRASIQNSGYNGWWSDFDNSRKFNNDYYVSIVAKGWGPEPAVNGNAGKNQWKRIDEGVDEANLGKEMMLNTDMCFYYTMDNDGHVQLDAATAESAECTCAWATAVPIQQGYTKYMGGKFCGTDDIPGSSDFPRQRAICCGLGDTYSINDLPMDCGLPVKPLGPAAKAIKRYTNDEDAWLWDFKKAWKVATTNGFDSLRMLK